MSRSPTVFFVTGFHKSGTTWTMNLLGSLPAILCLGEGRFFSSELEELPSLYDGLEQGLRTWHRFQAHRKGNWIENEDCVHTLHRQNLVEERAYGALFQRDLRRLVRHATEDFLLARAASKPSATHVGDKTPLTSHDQLGRVHAVFPDAPILFLERDVHEVIVSLALHHWRSRRDMRPDRHIRLLDETDYLWTDRFQRGLDPERGIVSPDTAARVAGRWARTRSEACRIRDAHPDRLMTVDYAGLLAEPATRLNAMLAFLGVAAEDSEVLAAIERYSRPARFAAGGPHAEHARSHTDIPLSLALNREARAAIAAAIA